MPLEQELWRFKDATANEEITIADADRLWRLYFPICNFAGMKSALTVNMRGDIKRGQNEFLSVPVSIEDLHSCNWGRNFWISTGSAQPWCASGTGSTYREESEVSCSARAGLGWLSVTRENRKLGLAAEITVFAPATDDCCEVMLVTVHNRSAHPQAIQPTYCLPVYARSADCLRSHRNLTTLLNRVCPQSHGMRFCPTMAFDERGHHLNDTSYFVLGYEQDGAPGAGGWCSLREFCGPREGLDRPAAVFHRSPPTPFARLQTDWLDTVAAIRFADATLEPGHSASYVIVHAISQSADDKAYASYGSLEKARAALEKTQNFWRGLVSTVSLKTADPDFDAWFRWVQYQPFLRKIYGCSFLPDHDYGRGGRGWRDLFQDLLGLLLTDPASAREELSSYFAGVRMDGSNATIIGSRPGEFIADRDGISRVWSDHGVWPWLTVQLYIEQTGDFSILLDKRSYWKDRQLRRATGIDERWTPAQGTQHKARDGTEVRASVLEHILLQHYVAHFHVGEHGLLRLEGADWDDGIDMARSRGETVHFTAMYASNMSRIATLLQQYLDRHGGSPTIEVSAEVAELMALGQNARFGSVQARQQHLADYFESVRGACSGRTVAVALPLLIADLKEKSESVLARIRSQQWLTTACGHGFFNGYYDEQGRRVHGDHPQRGLQMSLAAQAMSLLAGLPDARQCEQIVASVNDILRRHPTGLPRLCTDTGGPYMELGRNFGYYYGTKENGAPFCHMVVMYAAGLIQCGFAAQGQEILSQLYRAAANTRVSRMAPGIPEYFEPDGRGAYCYLTGSGAWFVLTLVTRLVGVRGSLGHLCIDPRYPAAGVSMDGWRLILPFAGRRCRITFRGDGKTVGQVLLEGRPVDLRRDPGGGVVIDKHLIASCGGDQVNLDVEFLS